MDSLGRSILTIEKAFDLDMARINRDVMFEFGMAEVNGSIPEYMMVYYEADGEAKPTTSTKPNIIKRIIDAIRRFIRDLSSSISDAFKNEDDVLTVEKYLASQTGKEQFSYDVDGVKAAVDQEILKGRKLVQILAKGTALPDDVVAEYVDGAKDFLSRHKGIIGAFVSTFALGKLRQKVSQTVFKNWEEQVDDLEQTSVGAFFSKFPMDTASVDAEKDKDYQKYLKDQKKEAKRNARKEAMDAKRTATAQKIERQRVQILNALSAKIQAGGKAIGKVSQELKGVYDRGRAKMNSSKK